MRRDRRGRLIPDAGNIGRGATRVLGPRSALQSRRLGKRTPRIRLELRPGGVRAYGTHPVADRSPGSWAVHSGSPTATCPAASPRCGLGHASPWTGCVTNGVTTPAAGDRTDWDPAGTQAWRGQRFSRSVRPADTDAAKTHPDSGAFRLAGRSGCWSPPHAPMIPADQSDQSQPRRRNSNTSRTPTMSISTSTAG